jgi:RNA polymerase sigma factor (sigma-70 family)
MPDKEDNQEPALLDSELLRLMATPAGGNDTARTAWEEFYRRHFRYLRAVCTRAFLGIVGQAGVPEIVHDTFIRAYQKAGTFRSEDGIGPDGDRRHVRGWLGRISENIVRDRFRDEPDIVFVEEDDLIAKPAQIVDDPLESRDSNRTGEATSPQLQRFETAFSTLSEREQEVLRQTAFWYRSDGQPQRMPNSAMKRITESLNISAANVRQIRARATAKLKVYMEQHEAQND